MFPAVTFQLPFQNVFLSSYCANREILRGIYFVIPRVKKSNLLHYAAPIYPVFEHHFISLMDELILVVDTSWLQKLQLMKLELCRHFFSFFFFPLQPWIDYRENRSNSV